MALRISHEPEPTDPTYAGQVDGISLILERMANVAPLAIVQTLSDNLKAKKLVNQTADGWRSWANIEISKDREGIPKITPGHPEWVILDWKKPVKLRGLMAFFAGFGSAEVQVFTGPESTPPRDAPDSDWKTIDDYENIENGYAVRMWPNWLPFPSDVTCRALRLKMTSTNKERHPHVRGKTMEGRRVWVDELMALSPLGKEPLKDLAVAAPDKEKATAAQNFHPPIPVKFTLKKPGYVTLVIERPDGFRVRNLISETHFPAGENTAWWDGTDDLQRDGVAAGHGLYRIPAHQVEPGEYRVRGLTREAIVPRLEFSVYTGPYRLVQTLGHPGVPKAGPYDPLHMNHPYGMALDSKNRLWVAERDKLPKRVSVWNLDGELVKAFYGPAQYGGGGRISSVEPNTFYYTDAGPGAMAFTLDWEKGTYQLRDIYYRAGPGTMELPFRNAAPDMAYLHDGKRYFTNCFNSSPVAGQTSAMLFQDRDGIVYPVAGVGRTVDWSILREGEFRDIWSEGTDPSLTRREYHKGPTYFVWSDLNADAHAQPDEVEIVKGLVSGITVMPDLSFLIARQEDRTLRFTPTEFTDAGVPLYNAQNPEVLAHDVLPAASSGGNQALHDPDGWTVLTLGAEPFPRRSVTGVKGGTAWWSYPNVWPGLHAGHTAPTPDRPGQLIGPTRLLSGLFTVPGSDAGPLWAINGNLGNVYVFTEDGLFVATLFHDKRLAPRMNMPKVVRGTDLSELSLGEENFWPSLTRTPEGKVYLVDGANSTIIRLDGFETVQRLPETSLTVTAELQFTRDQGNYQFSVPLRLLGLTPKPGVRLQGDIGVLRGADYQTNTRVYWGNKATGITSDVPSEAELIPALWGTLEFQSGAEKQP